jgi:hypothetical protein
MQCKNKLKAGKIKSAALPQALEICLKQKRCIRFAVVMDDPLRLTARKSRGRGFSGRVTWGTGLWHHH